MIQPPMKGEKGMLSLQLPATYPQKEAYFTSLGLAVGRGGKKIDFHAFGKITEITKATRSLRVALLLICDELPAYERDGVGVGVTPSCCNNPAWSTVPQCSTILPSLKRLM